VKRVGRLANSLFLLIVGMFVLITEPAVGQPVHVRPRVPVIVQASGVTDACANGVVFGLAARGDGFLAVKAGPGLRYGRIEKLYNGEPVYLCADAGDWWGIVYTRKPQDCKVSTPWPRTLPYAGPCRSGWARKKWIRLTAG
jgi:hypothetical protein